MVRNLGCEAGEPLVRWIRTAATGLLLMSAAVVLDSARAWSQDDATKAGETAQGAGSASVSPADAIYVNAKVETMNHDKPRAQAIAIRGTLIIATGSNSEIKLYIGPATKVTDLYGGTVLPGFIDPHSHMLGYAFYLDKKR